MNITQATTVAEEFASWIEPYCRICTVAGSVRRGKADGIKDIELVVVPKFEEIAEPMSLFPDPNLPPPVEDLLANAISHLITNGHFHLDQETKRNGPKYKRFKHLGAVVELFIAEPDNYGNILAIRTGNSEFSHSLVTPRNHGGLMPSYLRQKDGYLWNSGKRVDCPSEADFFAALGYEVPPAKERDVVLITKMLRGTYAMAKREVTSAA